MNRRRTLILAVMFALTLSVPTLATSASSGKCVPSTSIVCVQHGRFGLSLGWASPDQQVEADALAQPFMKVNSAGLVEASQEAGVFSYFGEDVELIVRVVDACIPALGNRYWVFVSGFTNVQWTLTVKDYSNSQGIIYLAHQGVVRTIQDTQGFACNPGS